MMHLYIEDSAELQIYRSRPMLNKVHMHVCLYSVATLSRDTSNGQIWQDAEWPILSESIGSTVH